MFTGNYEVSLTAKNRITIPSKLRSKLKGNLIYCSGIYEWLEFYEKSYLNTEILQKISDLHQDKQDFARVFFANLYELEIDKQGRILLPESLVTKFVSIELIFIGTGNYFELWDNQLYKLKTEYLLKEKRELSERLAYLLDKNN